VQYVRNILQIKLLSCARSISLRYCADILCGEIVCSTFFLRFCVAIVCETITRNGNRIFDLEGVNLVQVYTTCSDESHGRVEQLEINAVNAHILAVWRCAVYEWCTRVRNEDAFSTVIF